MREGHSPLVLYSAESPPQRRAFTLAHEVGHICLGHRDDGPENEAEANLFAANLIIPRIFLWELRRLCTEAAAEQQVSGLFLASKQVVQLQLRNLPRSADAFLAAEHELLRAYKSLLPPPGEAGLGF